MTANCFYKFNIPTRKTYPAPVNINNNINHAQ